MKLRIKALIFNIRKQKHLFKTARRKKELKKNEDSVRSLWDKFKHTNICIMEVPEGEEREQELGNQFEKNNDRKLPELGEGKKHMSPGNAESP